MNNTISISPQINLIALSIDDAPALLKLIQQNKRFLVQYFPWAATINSITDTESYIRKRISPPTYTSFYFGIYLSGGLSGIFGVKSLDSKRSIAELGYWLGESATGQGIMQQIIPHVSAALSQQHYIEIMEFICLKSNKPSIKLLTKLGAREIKDQLPAFVQQVSLDWVSVYQLKTS